MVHHIHLKAIRELRNLSQAYVARKIGVSQSYYSKLENGSLKNKHELINKVLAILDAENLFPLFNNSEDMISSIKQQIQNLNEINEIIKSHENRLSKIEHRLSIGDSEVS